MPDHQGDPYLRTIPRGPRGKERRRGHDADGVGASPVDARSRPAGRPPPGFRGTARPARSRRPAHPRARPDPRERAPTGRAGRRRRGRERCRRGSPEPPRPSPRRRRHRVRGTRRLPVLGPAASAPPRLAPGRRAGGGGGGPAVRPVRSLAIRRLLPDGGFRRAAALLPTAGRGRHDAQHRARGRRHPPSRRPQPPGLDDPGRRPRTRRGHPGVHPRVRPGAVRHDAGRRRPAERRGLADQSRGGRTGDPPPRGAPASPAGRPVARR